MLDTKIIDVKNFIMTTNTLHVTVSSSLDIYYYQFDIDRNGQIEHGVIEYNKTHQSLITYKVDENGERFGDGIRIQIVVIDISTMIKIIETLEDMYGKRARVVLELINRIYQDGKSESAKEFDKQWIIGTNYINHQDHISMEPTDLKDIVTTPFQLTDKTE